MTCKMSGSSCPANDLKFEWFEMIFDWKSILKNVPPFRNNFVKFWLKNPFLNTSGHAYTFRSLQLKAGNSNALYPFCDSFLYSRKILLIHISQSQIQKFVHRQCRFGTNNIGASYFITNFEVWDLIEFPNFWQVKLLFCLQRTTRFCD